MNITIFVRKFSLLASIFGVLTLTFLNKAGCDDVHKYDENKIDKDTETSITDESGQPRKLAEEVYKHMFLKHRLTQHEATKAVTKFNYEKRYQLVLRMLKQLFETLEEAKTNVTVYDLHPGGLFPEDEIERDSVSKIYENVFLFGDLLLRMPEMVHSIFDRRQEWRYILGWALEWCELSNLFEGPAKVILEIISQEGDITPRQDDWIPDYSNMTEIEFDLVKTFYETYVLSKDLDKIKKMAAANEKKGKKKLKKGPRMSREDL